MRGRKDSSGPASAEAGGEAEEGEEALEGGFEFCAGRPLDCDALLVDESSMLDLPLAAALLDALPRHRRVQLVLVGVHSAHHRLHAVCCAMIIPVPVLCTHNLGGCEEG